jgi:hypothetical protein
MVEHMAQITRDQLLAFDSHFKPQAASNKPQAASNKQQALTNKNKGLYRINESKRSR